MLSCDANESRFRTNLRQGLGSSLPPGLDEGRMATEQSRLLAREPVTPMMPRGLYRKRTRDEIDALTTDEVIDEVEMLQRVLFD